MFNLPKRRRAEDLRADERDQELRRTLLEGGRSSPDAKQAIAFCERQLNDYEHLYEFNERRWFLWQRLVIVGGVVATLAGVVTIPDAWLWWLPHPELFGWLRGVPAGIVTIASAFLSSFTFREDAVRNEVTANALWNELIRFQAHASPY